MQWIQMMPIGFRMGWQWNIAAARNGDRWRQGRRILDRGLRPGGTASYRSMIQARAHALLSRLLANPDQWEAHTELSVLVLPRLAFCPGIELFGKKTFSFQGELVLATAYGYEAHERDGVMIDAAKKVNKFGIEHIQPGALLVNHIPFRMCSRFFPALMET